MSAERLIASHLRLAQEACEGATLLLEGCNRNAVYLAEQAVEQMMLAVALTSISALLSLLSGHFAVRLDAKDEPAGKSRPPR